MLNFIFLNKHGPKSKASGETIDVIYDPTSTTVEANKDFTVSIKIKPSVDVSLRGYYFKIPFDKTKINLKNIEYKVGVASADLGQTNSNLTTINQNGILELFGEVQNSTGQVIAVSVTGSELVKLTFTAVSVTGTSFQADAKFYITDLNGVITEAGITTVPKYDINGGGALITPGVSVTGTPTGSATTGNIKLNLKLKFQGINKKPADSQNSMVVKAKLKKQGTTNTVDGQGTFTADGNGIWSGTVGFNITDVGGKWLIFVKGPQHLQKKICDSAASETTGGTYKCADGNISLVVGDNSLNFSGITLLVGDLDQNGITDAVDIGLVKNNFGKKDTNILAKADLNRDGVVDTQDFSLILAALAVRTDEL